MDVVHRLQPRQGEEGAGDEIDPAGAHFILRTGPGTGVKDVDLHADLITDAVQQIGIGTNQQLGIVRVAPEVRRVLGVARRHQVLTLLGRQGEGRNQQAGDQQRSEEETSVHHGVPVLELGWEDAGRGAARP